jgi:hypothetical protein
MKRYIVIGLILIITGCVSIPSGVDKETDKEIRRVLQIVKRYESNNIDVYKDGEFDCKDRALIFYLNFRGNAQIVNNQEINHAFIKVYTANGFVLVEPMTYIQDDYTMRGRWGNQFNGRAADRTAVYMALYNAWGGK